MVKTLDELKAENDSEDEGEALKVENEPEKSGAEESPQGSDEDDKTGEVDEKDGETDEGAEPDPDKPGDSETEDWKKGDDHALQAEKKYTGKDIGAAKAKLKSRLADKNSELEKANARIAELETASKPVQSSDLERPKREDFYDEDDSDAAYEVAYEKYLLNKVRANQSAETAATDKQRVQKQAQQKISQGEDAHYERVAKLVTASGIKPETYQTADLAFRQAIDAAVPGGGDVIAATFMGKLGEGSDKVVYNIGINSEKQFKLTQLLRDDPTGIDASMYLSKLKASLVSPAKRKTNAPKPPPDIKSDAVLNTDGKGLLIEFKKADKSGNMQLMTDVLRMARAAGVDSKNW